MLIEQLKKLGFSDGEAKVYISALELGETTVVRIAKKAKLERTTTYGLVENLKKRGLLSVHKKNGKTSLTAENPKKLKLEIEEKGNFVDRILPELLSITNTIDKKPVINFYEDKEGIYDIYRETLLFKNEPIHMWMSTPWYDDESCWRDFYIPKRLENKIALKAIMPNNDLNKSFSKDSPSTLRETRLVNTEDITSDIMLYGKRNIAIISFDEMTAITIESKNLYVFSNFDLSSMLFIK